MTTQLINKYAVLMAEQSEWEGETICKIFLEALTEANFHSLRKELEVIIDREFE
jgi:hypothetical protein